LTVRTSRDDSNIGWVVNGYNDTSRKDDLLPFVDISFGSAWTVFEAELPGLSDINDVDSIGTGSTDG
jgi:hypothetical protein